MTDTSAIRVRGVTLDDFRHLFPKATGINHNINDNATVQDTLKLMPKAVMLSRWMVKNYVAQELKHLPLYEACKKLWFFAKHIIGYKRDKTFVEQIKTARRLIADGEGDCDCKTCFINACMVEYGVSQGIINRITAYDYASNFSHIYSLIPDGNGKYIIMDSVWNAFNTEKPFTKKQDHIMELQLLDGIDDEGKNKFDRNARYLLTMRNNEIGELGKLKKKKNNAPAGPKKKKEGFFKKIGKGLVKAVSVVNKINPAMVLLRAGFLAIMKLNMFKVAERLKWGYATREFAQSKGMDMSKYDKLKKVLEKAEKIFYGAGGSTKNLKKAILTGKGNKNHEVAGLNGLNENTPLSQLLGDIYHDEFVNGMDGFEGFGELGEPVTGAAIAAATTAVTAVVAALKSVGTLFPKKEGAEKGGGESASDSGGAPAESNSGSEASAPAETSSEAAPLPEDQTTPPSDPGSAEVPEAPAAPEPSENLPAPTDEAPADPPAETPGEPPADLPVPSEPPTDGTNGVLDGIGTGIKAFWDKSKKWLIPVSIGAVVVGGLIYMANKDEAPQPKQKNYALNGVKPKKRKPRKGGNGKSGNKEIIALM